MRATLISSLVTSGEPRNQTVDRRAGRSPVSLPRHQLLPLIAVLIGRCGEDVSMRCPFALVIFDLWRYPCGQLFVILRRNRFCFDVFSRLADSLLDRISGRLVCAFDRAPAAAPAARKKANRDRPRLNNYIGKLQAFWTSMDAITRQSSIYSLHIPYVVLCSNCWPRSVRRERSAEDN